MHLDPLQHYAAHEASLPPLQEEDDAISADTFADWLYSHCYQKDGQSLGTCAAGLQVESADVPTLLLTALDAARRQRADFAAYLLREIERRFEARGV
jgi:hypothetical protein